MGRKNVTTNKVNVLRETIAVWTESACERGHRPDRTPVYQGLQYDAAESKIDWLWERKRLLGLELILVSGLVKFVPVVACHFCFNLPAAFSQPLSSIISGPSIRETLRSFSIAVFGDTFSVIIYGYYEGIHAWVLILAFAHSSYFINDDEFTFVVH